MRFQKTHRNDFSQTKKHCWAGLVRKLRQRFFNILGSDFCIPDFSYSCFFLGAGFMLIETKSITEMAKIFGSTWLVTSVVIGSILLMAFFANYLVNFKEMASRR